MDRDKIDMIPQAPIIVVNRVALTTISLLTEI